MAKKPEIAQVGIGIPEWCLYAYINDPAPEEITATAKFILDNPDIAKSETVITDAAFSLICRTQAGGRLFGDMEIFMLSKRQRSIIDGVVQKYLPVAEPVLDAIETALKKGKSDDAIN